MLRVLILHDQEIISLLWAQKENVVAWLDPREEASSAGVPSRHASTSVTGKRQRTCKSVWIFQLRTVTVYAIFTTSKRRQLLNWGRWCLGQVTESCMPIIKIFFSPLWVKLKVALATEWIERNWAIPVTWEMSEESIFSPPPVSTKCSLIGPLTELLENTGKHVNANVTAASQDSWKKALGIGKQV